MMIRPLFVCGLLLFLPGAGPVAAAGGLWCTYYVDETGVTRASPSPEPTATEAPATPTPSPSPTETPSPTATLSPTPTPTPTPIPTPSILWAGYWRTRLSANEGGQLDFWALTETNDGPAIGRVEILLEGGPTGVFLEWSPIPNLFWLQGIEFLPGTPPTKFLLGLRATNAGGKRSLEWPYLHVR
jgi:hypothetical protein